MKEIVVISGKGGTGKTSITASFAILGARDVVVADCDVDAADMHLLLEPDFKTAEDFYSGVIAKIDQDICTKCGKCAEVCRFGAIPVIDGKYIAQPLDCEGCGYCARVCPVEAIAMNLQNVGEWYISTIKTGSSMVHARLGIGAENSGKLVAKVKNEAKRIAEEQNRKLVIVDGSPGIGCPVVSSLSGANFVVLVTEPTVSGIHDLKRVYQLVRKFGIKAGCIINKADLNDSVAAQISDFLNENDIVHIADLPYDESFTKAMTRGKTIVEFDKGELYTLIRKSWESIKDIVISGQKGKKGMKIVFTAKGANWGSVIDSRFGRTDYFFVYNEESDEVSIVDNRSIINTAHGAGPQTAQKLFELKPDVLITGNGPGGNAARVLAQGNIKIYVGAGDMTVKDAYEAYKKGELKEF